MLVRKLTSLEDFFCERSRLNLHSCFYLAVELNRLPNKQQLFKSLKAPIAKYPQLHYNITTKETSGDIYIKEIESPIFLEDVCEYKEWEQFAEDEINSIFQSYNFQYDQDTPLWKILLIPSKRIMVLLIDHVLFDGMSAVKFWECFVGSLSMSVESTEDDKILEMPLFQHEQANKTQSASSHAYESWPIPWSWKIKRRIAAMLWNWYPSAILAPPSNLFQFKKYSFPDGLLRQYPNDTSNSTGYVVRNDNRQWTLNVPTNSLQKILKSCKENNVSLTSFLVGLMTIALGKCNSDSYSGDIVSVGIPMNTRSVCSKYLKINDEDLQMGNFVGGLDFKQTMEGDLDIWQIASNANDFIKLNTGSKISDIINNVKLLDMIEAKDFVEKKVEYGKNGPPSTFEVTNLGFQAFKESCQDTSSFYIKNAIFNEPQGISDLSLIHI